jgi:fatty-acyl-CoA synthase
MVDPGLGTWIDRHARRAPEAVALRGPGFEFTYRSFARRIGGLAVQLTERGIVPGDRVAYHGGNDPAALTSLFASAAVGAIWVPIHPARPEDEVAWVLDDAAPSLLIRAEPETHPETHVPELSASDLPDDGADGWIPDRNAGPDEVVMLPYTSGTTGRPKAVLLTHSNILWNVIQLLMVCGFTRDDVALAVAPLTRMGGLGVTVLPTLFVGGTVVIPAHLDGPAVLRSIEEDRVSIFFGNPDVLSAAVDAPEWPTTDLSSIRTAIVGGGLVPEPLLRSYLDRGVNLRHGYGLTEAAPVVSLLDEREAAERPFSVGRALPFVDVRALRPDGTECEPGEVGEWVIRGPNVCAGYRGEDRARDEEGWLHTGDLGSIDADGYLTFFDRASSAMRIGGDMVYPAAVELCLYGVPGIADAAVAEVDGRLVAAVVPRTGDGLDVASILASLRDRLPSASVPTELRTIAAIPRNAAGKVLRERLRELLAAPMGP